jgi:hypothetical protein
MNLIPAAGGAEPVSKRVERFSSHLLSVVVARVIRSAAVCALVLLD